jgi:hypothetical protein
MAVLQSKGTEGLMLSRLERRWHEYKHFPDRGGRQSWALQEKVAE